MEAETSIGSGRKLTGVSEEKEGMHPPGEQQENVPAGWSKSHFPVPSPLASLMDPRGHSGPSPHLPDVVQKLGGGEAVFGAGELAAVVLEEGQQVGLEGKQPVERDGCQPDPGFSSKLSIHSPQHC